MYVPQNFFDKFHAERLLLKGERTKFAEYVEHQKQMTMLERIKESLAAIWPPTHEEVEATVWYRYGQVVTGVKVLTVRMPYRQWMQGTTLVSALTEELNRQLKGQFLKPSETGETFRNDLKREVIMLGDPRTGKRYWKFFK